MSRFLPVLLCAPALLLSGAGSNKKPVTLDALFAGGADRMPRGAGSPVWAPDGLRFVYQQDGHLWLYELDAKKRTDLVNYRAFDQAATQAPKPERFGWENRGVREQRIQWFPSGRELLISAGGDLFLFRIGARGWTQLTATPVSESDPKLSPDGRKVSFRREHDLYVLDLATKKETRLTQDGSATLLNGELDWVYPEELALGTAYWWSPDSKSIAYMQFDVSREPLFPQVSLGPVKAVSEPERYPQAGDPNADVHVGVVAASGGRTRWLDFGETRGSLLARVYWAPDSRSVFAVKMNRVQNHLQLLSADVETGASHAVLQESDPHWINLIEDLRWLAGGKEFLWTSERDGFNHIYRYSSSGKPLARLTHGDWMVGSIACVDEAARSVYYVSTQPSPLERQLYRVSLDGGEPVRISEGAGTHRIDMAPNCGAYLDNYSSMKVPPHATLRRNDGSVIEEWRKADTGKSDQYDIIPAEIVEVKASDGTALYGRLIKPAGYEPGKRYPVIVDVYGGPHAQSVQDTWQGDVSLDQVFAHKGYAVWALDNRGSFNRGHKFETAVFHNLGSVELEDQKAGIQKLVDMGIADPKRIGIQGWSYGGYMTLFSILNAPDVFAAGCAGAPVTNWRNYDTIYTERYMGLPSENPEGYRKSAPVNAASNLKGKLLIIHNIEDDNVLIQNTAQMAFALENANRKFSMVLYPGKSHGLMGPGRKHYIETMVEFFDDALKP